MKSLVLALSLIGSIASASQIGNKTVNSCEILSPFKLTPSETAELAQHGYTVKVKRSAFHYDRFLQVYNYYQLKDHAARLGDLYVQTVIVPDGYRQYAGAQEPLLSKRELSFRAITKFGIETIAFANSTPPFAHPTDEEFKNAKIGQMPNCL